MMTRRELYKPLILCVDDDKGILDLIRTALEGQGYRVLTSTSGAAALEAFAACPVDAVILDYEMPGMNGAEVAREMARIKPHIPKLLFAGRMRIPPNGLFAITSEINAMTTWARSA